jgi:DNA-binding NarL/FixJ family response regulator
VTAWSAEEAMMAGGLGSRVLVMVRDGARTAPIRVALAGPRPDVRRALQIRLALERDVAVVGSTSSAQAVLPVLRRLRLDVLLVDVDMAPEPPEEALRRARAMLPGLRLVLLTHHRDRWPDSRLALAAADEVVDKGPDAGPLLASLRRTAERRPQGFV